MTSPVEFEAETASEAKTSNCILVSFSVEFSGGMLALNGLGKELIKDLEASSFCCWSALAALFIFIPVSLHSLLGLSFNFSSTAAGVAILAGLFCCWLAAWVIVVAATLVVVATVVLSGTVLSS